MREQAVKMVGSAGVLQIELATIVTVSHNGRGLHKSHSQYAIVLEYSNC